MVLASAVSVELTGSNRDVTFKIVESVVPSVPNGIVFLIVRSIPPPEISWISGIPSLSES